MSIATRSVVGIAMLIGVSTLEAQALGESGPTVRAARIAMFAPAIAVGGPVALQRTDASCGSLLKNAALLGLGFSLAAGVLELTYTIVREPLVRNGHDVPRADPTLIAWAGAAGFVIGLIGTEVCRRKR